MPASLRFVLALLALALLASVAAIIILDRQEAAQGRITAEQISGGRVVAGKLAITRRGCAACHDVPGISGTEGLAGPSLAKVAVRAEIAGVLANTPGNMVRWLRDPQGVVPGNGMPNQGIGEQEARDIAAYLYTIKG
jgi:cytochrome c1